MEIRVLRYFLTIVQEESITRAANVLHITQPTLSRQIAQLEDSMGVRLFERGTRKIVLTDEGILLRRRAQEILELVDKTEKELTAQDEMVEGTVSVGYGDLSAVQMLPKLFKDFHDRYPAVNFDLYTATADHIRDRMDQGLTDVGLLLEPVNLDKYEFIRLNCPEEWVAVMPLDSPLASLEHVTAKDLLDVPLILPGRQNVRNELASWFGDAFDKLNVLFTSNLTANSAVMVYHKLAVSIAIRGSISFWDREKITYRPLYPPLIASSVLAWKRRQPFGAAAEKFIAYAKEALDKKQG